MSGRPCQATLTIPRTWRITEGLESRWSHHSNSLRSSLPDLRKIRTFLKSGRLTSLLRTQHPLRLRIVERDSAFKLGGTVRRLARRQRGD